MTELDMKSTDVKEKLEKFNNKIKANLTVENFRIQYDNIEDINMIDDEEHITDSHMIEDAPQSPSSQNI